MNWLISVVDKAISSVTIFDKATDYVAFHLFPKVTASADCNGPSDLQRFCGTCGSGGPGKKACSWHTCWWNYCVTPPARECCCACCLETVNC